VGLSRLYLISDPGAIPAVSRFICRGDWAVVSNGGLVAFYVEFDCGQAYATVAPSRTDLMNEDWIWSFEYFTDVAATLFYLQQYYPDRVVCEDIHLENFRWC